MKTDIEIIVEPANPADAQEYLELSSLDNIEGNDLMTKNLVALRELGRDTTGKLRIRIVFPPGGEEQAIKYAKGLAARLGRQVT